MASIHRISAGLCPMDRTNRANRLRQAMASLCAREEALTEYYQTLSSPTRADLNNVPRVQLALSEDTKEKEIRSLLLAMHASIVQGPNSLGVYVVALPKHSPAQLAQVLGELRAHPQVRFAERAAPATQ